MRHTITLFAIVVAVVLVLTFSVTNGAGVQAQSKPNVVLIVADDLGYADVGYHGCKDVPTPHIDSIARAGLYFTDGYSNGAVCAPTRAALMTGRYQGRFGSHNNPGPFRRTPEVKIGVSPDQPILAELMKPLGYATACFGKWHLGGEVFGDPALMPLNRGYDEFFGFLEGAASYIDSTNREKKYWRGGKLIKSEEEYYTDALGREAISFIQRHKDETFFLYLPFSAVHAPMQAPVEYLARFSEIENGLRRKLAAMLSAMDDNIGRVLTTLKEEGLENNTLVIFMSDNGGKPGNNGSLNTPLRGQKGEFFEGGFRIPFCIKWPGHVQPGGVYRKPVMGFDILPTVLIAAGGKIDPAWKLDGVDLMPYLAGTKKGRPHDNLFWSGNNRYAIRHVDWKLVHEKGKTHLFDLAKDKSETTDVSEAHPEVKKELQKKYREWLSEIPPPNYGWNPQIGKRVENPWKWERPMEK